MSPRLAMASALVLLVFPVGCHSGERSAALNRLPEGSNRLIHEKSPYLLQHAHNPVDWYPWGEEALARAQAEDKPIFLSIGYSTCHWCHVMERECFENPAIAALLNELFVCIKVDREERPDLDEIYMAAVQAMTGQGGWPLNVWLTPDLHPFYGGTYFPPEDRYGRPGLPRVARALAEAWRERREEVLQQSQRLVDSLSRLTQVPVQGRDLDRGWVDAAQERLEQIFDEQWGGFGEAPKFPRADFGEICLRQYRRNADEKALHMALRTLERMQDGGIYDHLGGGFSRYSTDRSWTIPHFEKMLYDNAQLGFHYVEAVQLTQREDFARTARGIFDYVLRDLRSPEGGFFSAEDADSEGEEGLFYAWTRDEVRELLDPEDAELFAAAYGLDGPANFEGKWVLARRVDDEALAADHELEVEEVAHRLERTRRVLFERRASRVRPALDDKVLTAWNGLMIRALARGAIVLHEPRYLHAAQAAARFVLSEMRDDRGLLRRWRDGEARFPAYAEDYAYFVEGLLELYQADFDLDWLEAAESLHRELFEHFADPSDGALYHTRADQGDLLVRAKSGYDGAVPTANSVAAHNALTLFELTGRDGYARQCEAILQAFSGVLAEAPLSMARLLLVLDAWTSERVELVLAAPPVERDAWLHRARGGYQPDLFVSAVVDDPRSRQLLPPLEGKVALDGPTAYVCRGFACRRPSLDPREWVAELGLRVVGARAGD